MYMSGEWLAITQLFVFSDAIKVSREVDPKGERTFGVLTKIDLMDQVPNAVDILEEKSYKLQFLWVGVVNRSQADINKSVDMIAARRREREHFANSIEYKYLSQRMGSEHLGTMLSKSKKLAKLLDEDPAVMQRRTSLGTRLELYKQAQLEIDVVAWSK